MRLSLATLVAGLGELSLYLVALGLMATSQLGLILATLLGLMGSGEVSLRLVAIGLVGIVKVRF